MYLLSLLDSWAWDNCRSCLWILLITKAISFGGKWCSIFFPKLLIDCWKLSRFIYIIFIFKWIFFSLIWRLFWCHFPLFVWWWFWWTIKRRFTWWIIWFVISLLLRSATVTFFLFFLSFGLASNVPKITHYGVV